MLNVSRLRGIEPGIDALQSRKAADQQTAPHEQRERERDLCDDESLAHPVAAMIADRARAVLQ